MDKKLFAGLLVPLLWALPATSRAISPEGYPGSTWGNLSRDFDGVEGNGTQGNVRQGVQWVTLPGNIPLQTYGFFTWRARSLNRPYYNTLGPGAGVALSKSIFDLGVDYFSQSFPEQHQTYNNAELYLSWYKYFEWTRPGDSPNLFGLPVVGFPLSSWGRAFDDFNNVEGTGVQGWVSQGIDWYRFPGDVVVGTKATYYFRFRSANRPYYNEHGPSLGVAANWNHLTAGVEYFWSDYPELHRNFKASRAYVSWYYWWDLKNAAKR